MMTNVPAEDSHRWLHRLVGKWDVESEAPAGEDGKPGPPIKAVETVRKIGEIWVQGEGLFQGSSGEGATTLMTLGYDPQRKAFVGTWLGTMMTHMWVYNGWLEDDGRKLVLEAEGPSFTDPSKTETYRDVIEWLGDNHRTLTGTHQKPDGEWEAFMTAHYRRAAAA